MPATIDFETRSAFDLRKGGAWGYAEHSSTEVMCLAVLMPDGFEFIWHPAYPSAGIEGQGNEALQGFFDYVSGGGLIEAHNVQFERAIWTHVGQRMGWPSVDHKQWRCSAALAATHALPRSLAGGADALGLSQQKDDKGSRVMKKISKPRLPLKADLSVVANSLWGDASRWKEVPKPKNMYELKRLYGHISEVQGMNVWHEKADELQMLFDYCQQDVRTEHALSLRLGELPPDELTLWQLDQEMNARGVQMDMPLVDKAIELSSQCQDESDARMVELTDEVVTTCNQRDVFINWVNTQALGDTLLEDTQKETIEKAVANPHWWTGKGHEALQVRLKQAKGSVKKYNAMKLVTNSDGRARGLLAYHGADTGRWAGRLIQPQNFPRGTASGPIDVLCDTIMTGDRDEIDFMYGPTMEALASALRGAMTAGPGYDLICSDYSSIEGRALFWLSGDSAGVRVFEQGQDIYKDMAAQIYGVIYKDVTKAQRQVGKQAILGLGYQMGWEKFRDTCAKVGVDLTDVFAKQVVKTYRASHHPVRTLWYDLEKHTIEAVRRGGSIVKLGKLSMFVSEDNFLNIQLPSGRCLRYFEPRVDWVISNFQDEEMEETYETAIEEGWAVEKADLEGLKTKYQLTYMGVNSVTRKFQRQSTYGGRLTENVVQGLSRDIMAEALIRIRETEMYFPVITVHDEIIAEVQPGQGSIEEFEQLMTVQPDWAGGFPVAADGGWRGHRYRK